jgi:uncharacterized membrane protein
VSPLVAIAYRIPFGRALQISVNRYSIASLIMVSGILTAQTYSGKFDVMGVDDRAYRIAHNKSQLDIDSFSTQGACAGLVSAALSGRIAPRSLMSFSLTGIALSVYGFCATKYLETPKGKLQYDEMQKRLNSIMGSMNMPQNK